MDSDSSTQRESVILKYVQEHPGSTNEQVIKGLDGTFSRVTVFNTLKTLKEYQMILVKKDKPNSQIHYLFINNENKTARQIQQLDDFERVFIPLLDRIKEENVKSYNSIIQDDKQPFTNHHTLFVKCLRIFHEVSEAYILRAIYEWPFEITDKNILSRMLHICFDKLRLIQVKMINIILESPIFHRRKDEDRIKFLFAGYRTSLFQDTVEALGGWHSFDKTQKDFTFLNIHEIEPVIKSLSTITREVPLPLGEKAKQVHHTDVVDEPNALLDKADQKGEARPAESLVVDRPRGSIPSLSSVLRKISDSKTLAILNSIALYKEGNSSPQSLPRMNLTTKQYYSRISSLISDGLIYRQKGRYFLTPIGKTAFEVQLTLGAALSYTWKKEAGTLVAVPPDTATMREVPRRQD